MCLITSQPIMYGSAWCLSGPCIGSKIDLSLLQHQSASQEKHGSMGDSSISLLGMGQEALYETSAACALSTFLCYI